MRIGCDVDGTLTRHRLPRWLEQVVYWSFWYVPGFQWAFRHIARRMRPNQYMVEAIRWHYAAGAEIHIICNRPLTMGSELKEWLVQWEIPFTGIHLPADKFSNLQDFKLERIRSLGVVRHYDDHVLPIPIVYSPVVGRP